MMKIKITKFTKLQQGDSLKGFVSVQLTEPMLEISGIAFHEKADRRWLQLPARQYVKPNGKRCWAYLVSFCGKENYKRFQNATLKGIDDLQVQEENDICKRQLRPVK